MPVGITVAAVLTAALLLAAWIGTQRQHRAAAAAEEQLTRAQSPNAGRARLDRNWDHLPAPVARYLRLAIVSSTEVEHVRIVQTGRLRTDAMSDRWMPFDATHLVVPRAAGFFWNARVQVAPLLHVRVHDALIDGKGSGAVSLMSAVPVSASADSLGMNSGSLHRFLAEAVWYPSALRPSDILRWTDIDATKSLATLTSHGITVSLEFWFGGSGEVVGIYTPARWGTFAGGYQQLPWEGHFSDYRERDGFMVPARGDVGWYIDGQWRAVWEGTVRTYHARAGQ